MSEDSMRACQLWELSRVVISRTESSFWVRACEDEKLAAL